MEPTGSWDWLLETLTCRNSREAGWFTGRMIGGRNMSDKMNKKDENREDGYLPEILGERIAF